MALEGRVFVAVGIWKNYEELEENLTLDELVSTHKSIAKWDHEHYKMLFGSQGHEIPDFEESAEEKPKTIDDVYRKATYGWDETKEDTLSEMVDLLEIGYEFES